MTKYGVVSDIHGNYPALSRVFDELTYEHEVDEVVCCGDVIGFFGGSRSTIQFIDMMADYIVHGNHDARMRDDYGVPPEYDAAIDEKRLLDKQLTDEEYEIINRWPERIETDDFIMAHSWPKRTLTDSTTVVGLNGDTGVFPRSVTKAGKYADGKYVFLGHTHEQFEQKLDKFEGLSGHIVNPGGLGTPWDSEAEYAVVDTDADRVSLESVEYDNSKVEDQLDYWDEKIGFKAW